MAFASSTRQNTNYARLCRLLIDTGTEALRNVFNGIHSPANFHKILSNSSPHFAKLKWLQKRGVVNPTLWRKLCTLSSAKFDITLLMVLLRNVCGLSPPVSTGSWDVLPPDSDDSIEANIVRIKFCRNDVHAHASKASVDDSTFNKLWTNISSAILGLASGANATFYATAISKVKTEYMDPDAEAHFRNLLNDWKKHDDKMKQMLEEGNQERANEQIVKIKDEHEGKGVYVRKEKAFQSHEKALITAIEIGDRAGEGRAYGNVGNAYNALGDYGKAIEYHKRSLKIVKEIGDWAGEGRAYGNLGNAYQSVGDYRKAIEYHEKHLKIGTEIGDRAGEGRAYGSLGNAYNSLGDFRQAIEYHTKHLEIAIEIGDRVGEGGAYGNLSVAYQSLGGYHKAIVYLEKGLKVATETGDRAGEGRAYGNLGNAYQTLGDYQKSIKYHEQHLKTALEIGDRAGEGEVYRNLAVAYQSLGDYRKPIEYHEKSLKIAKEVGDWAGEGRAYGNLGNAYQSFGDYQKAIAYHEQHLKTAIEIGDRAGEGRAYGNLGVAYQSLGVYHKAIVYLEKRLKVATETGDRPGEGRAYRNLRNAYQTLGDYVKAFEYHEKHLEIAKEIRDRAGEGEAYGNLSDAYTSLGDYRKAIKYHGKHFKIETGFKVKNERMDPDAEPHFLDLLNDGKNLDYSSKEMLEEPKASDVREGKGDKKAIDEEVKQFGGNEDTDDGGGAEADKTERQGQEYYKQDTYDDDLSRQISETRKEDFSHGICKLQMEEQEQPDKVAIFEGTVKSEGFHLDLNLGAIHLTFPRDSVAEATGIMVYRWKYGACLPQLMEHEAVVSDVIEISATTEDGDLNFNSEVKLVLSHSAAGLQGYELVMKRLTDTEKNEWEVIAGCKDIRQVSDIGDYLCPNNVPYSFPVVRAGIAKCGTYAVVSRLKLSPKYTITVSGGTFVHPSYPQVRITVPQNAVTTETELSLELGVQEVPQDEFQGHGLFSGPILHVLCFSRAAFLEPVTVQLPVSLRNELVNIPQPSECRVRVFFRSAERETKEWVEISDKLEIPASYDGELVKFKVQRFSGYAFFLDWTSYESGVIAFGIIAYLSSITTNQPLVANFFAYFDPKERLGSHDVLFLICCPAHRSKDVKEELKDAGLTPYEATSKRDMIPGRDKAFVFVSGGINFANSEDKGGFYLRFHGNERHKDHLQVRLINDKVHCKVEFYDAPYTTENNNLLFLLSRLIMKFRFSCTSTNAQENKEYFMKPSEDCQYSSECAVPGGEMGERCSSSPPLLSVTLKQASDIQILARHWDDVDHRPIDVLLVTAEECEFLSCLPFLEQLFKSYIHGIGFVYFGCMGGASGQKQLKVALVSCSKGSATPRGSLTVAQSAIRVLQPKALVSVGICTSLVSEKVRVGDVVIPSKLISAEGFCTPVSPCFGNLARDAPYGWIAPLKNRDELEVKVHCDGDILSQSLTEKCRYDDIFKHYPGAVASETEGKGVYSAAYDANIEWVIVKGVASYFYQGQSATSEWMSFASTMAASVVAKMLNDPTVFQKWAHYSQGMNKILS